jgi:hypothetical protein
MQTTNQEHWYSSYVSLSIKILWFVACLLALGFPAKYRERLRLFEELYKMDPDYLPWSGPAAYSDRGTEGSQIKSMRQKQQVSKHFQNSDLKIPHC